MTQSSFPSWSWKELQSVSQKARLGSQDELEGIIWETCLCFSSAKDTVYSGVIRGKMKAFTESKYCINYFPLEITSLNCTFQTTFLGKVQHSSLIFAHIYSELPCFHKFSSKVSVVHKLGVGAEGGAKLVWYQFKSTAFCNGKFSLTRVKESHQKLAS